jgi:hypothetical protein
MRERLISLQIVLLAFLGLTGSAAFAMDSADVLPSGVHSPALRAGVISGVSQRYAGDGSLVTLTDVHSLEFNVQQLQQMEPRVQQLVHALNQFGRQDFGDNLNLGTLRIDINPEIRYYAPLHAFGVTPGWTVAAGLPIVQYRNKITMSQTGSNIAQIRAQTGGLSKDLDSAFNELEVGLINGAKNELASKGYKPLTDRSETIIGDLQLASLYKVFTTPRFAGQLKTVVNLPTGPSDDPDDLADLGAFGQTAVDQIAVLTYRPHRLFQAALKAAYRLNFSDRYVMRVPKDSEDTLPGPETKEMVRRKIGDAITLGASGTVFMTKTINAGVGIEGTQKTSDSYSGDGTANYSLLARNSDASSMRFRAGLGYDTTQAYLDSEAILPTVVSYEFSDTIRGTNIERQTIHEIWLTLFF